MNEIPLPDLLLSFENQFQEIKAVLVALSHEKRLQILLSLLTGDKSFHELKKEVKLKKTALASHLTQMISVQLISKPAYNTYSLHTDGDRFLRVIEGAFRQSNFKVKKDKERLETRQFSKKFASEFFGLDEPSQ